MARSKMPHLGHAKHLCYLVNIGYHKSNANDFKKMVKQGRYICKRCGRVSNRKMNLCNAAKL
jgi:hypothetical protein